MENNHWITFTAVSPLAQQRMQNALDACYMVHGWTLDYIKGRFVDTMAVPKNEEIGLILTHFIRENRLIESAQRYTLLNAAFDTARYFRQNAEISQGDHINFPPAIPRTDYREFEIKPRKVWKKYLEFYSGISTTFGMLVLEGNWQEELTAHAEEMHISMSYLPFLWHSATIRLEDEPKIKFNFHSLSSAPGKKRKKENTEAHRAGKDWTAEEETELQEMITAGKTAREIGKELGRSERSVANKTIKLGIGRKNLLVQKMVERNREFRHGK